MKHLWLCAGLILLAGCGGVNPIGEDISFLDAAPDIDAYMADVTGDSAEIAEGIISKAINDPIYSSQYLVITKEGVAQLNEAVRTALNPVVSIVKEQGNIKDDSIQWGPYDYGNGTYRFRIVRVRARTFGWKLEAKPKQAEDTQYMPVLAGGIHLGQVARRGSGVIGIDADALAKIEPSLSCQGKLLMAFVHGDKKSRAMVYTLKDFTWNTEKHPPVSALVRAVRGVSGSTIVRMVAHADLSDPQNDSRELVISRVRWVPGVGGRADALVFNAAETQATGDIPKGSFWVANSCWNAQKQQTGKRVRECARGEAINDDNCIEIVRAEGSCATHQSLMEKLPHNNPLQAPGEGVEEGLEDPAAIQGMPDGSGEGI